MSGAAGRSRWLGRRPRLPAVRLASLVPSLTEAVFELGRGGSLVARTEWCVSPAGEVDAVEAVGGTKNPDVARLLELAPDVVLANREENTRRRILALAEQVPVWLTDPHGPGDVPELWTELGVITGEPERGSARAEEARTALAAVVAEAEAQEGPAPRFVYWVWRDPWMAAGHDTYISRLLEAAGLANALPPAAHRFPHVSPGAIVTPAVHLFASEPFAFELPRDLEALGTAEAVGEAVYSLPGGSLALLVDGQLFSWYPGRTAAALSAAAKLARELGRRLPGSGPG